MTPGPEFRRCSVSILDTIGDPTITFDRDGVSHYVHEYRERASRELLSPAQQTEGLQRWIRKIQASPGRYNCLMGLSGGLDSSFVAWLAWKHRLRPLVIHLDNGWNSELAVKNIENILRVTGFDYHNHVIDWEEFRDLQVAYLRSSVVDCEVPTDHAIFAILVREAVRHRIPYILIGDNPRTERVMPRDWSYDKTDLWNLLHIHRTFGSGKKFRSMPLLGRLGHACMREFHGLQHVPLNHFGAHTLAEMEDTLGRDFGFKNYRWKHCESVYTRFYQGYILPRKGGLDKRKAHLSDLILSGQIPRAEALRRLEEPYYSPAEEAADRTFVCKKLGLGEAELEKLLEQPIRPHRDFPAEPWGAKEERRAGWCRKVGRLLNRNGIRVRWNRF
jgi:hypothetical protein